MALNFGQVMDRTSVAARHSPVVIEDAAGTRFELTAAVTEVDAKGRRTVRLTIRAKPGGGKTGTPQPG